MIERGKLYLLELILNSCGYIGGRLKLYKCEFSDVSSSTNELLSSNSIYYSDNLSELEKFVKSVLYYYNTSFYKKTLRCSISSFELSTSIPVSSLEFLMNNESEYLTESNINDIVTLDSRFIYTV